MGSKCYRDFSRKDRATDELARKYVETHDNEIIEELYKLACELEKMEKLDVIFKGTQTSAHRLNQ
jgi:hypothetical protein